MSICDYAMLNFPIQAQPLQQVPGLALDSQIHSSQKENKKRNRNSRCHSLHWLKGLMTEILSVLLLLSPQHLKQYLVHSTSSINICCWLAGWLGRWMDGNLEACILFLSHVLLPYAATDSLNLIVTPFFSRKRGKCSGPLE